MTATLQQLIDSLRHELQQYGEMLALLEAQRGLILRRDSDSVVTSITTVEGQAAVLVTARQSREFCQRQLAWALGRPPGESFADLLPCLPLECRPLVSALVEEIDRLLEQVRERASFNHDQLRRSLQLMERFIATLSSQAESVRPAGETDSSRTDQAPPFAAAIV